MKKLGASYYGRLVGKALSNDKQKLKTYAGVQPGMGYYQANDPKRTNEQNARAKQARDRGHKTEVAILKWFLDNNESELVIRLVNHALELAPEIPIVEPKGKVNLSPAKIRLECLACVKRGAWNLQKAYYKDAFKDIELVIISQAFKAVIPFAEIKHDAKHSYWRNLYLEVLHWDSGQLVPSGVRRTESVYWIQSTYHGGMVFYAGELCALIDADLMASGFTTRKNSHIGRSARGFKFPEQYAAGYMLALIPTPGVQDDLRNWAEPAPDDKSRKLRKGQKYDDIRK